MKQQRLNYDKSKNTKTPQDPHGSRCVDPENCKVSTGICDRLTFGAGKLDEYGYWEIPCDHCARKHERDNPNDGECWPWASIDNNEHERDAQT